MRLHGIVLICAAFLLAPVMGRADTPPDDLCNGGPPSLSRAMEVSDKVVLYVVSAVAVQPDPLPGDGVELIRGTFELTPLATLKGEAERTRTSVYFDATLYPELFGEPPCRWSPLPTKGALWIATGSRDGENCAQCDLRLDSVHDLGWRAPLDSFLR